MTYFYHIRHRQKRTDGGRDFLPPAVKLFIPRDLELRREKQQYYKKYDYAGVHGSPASLLLYTSADIIFGPAEETIFRFFKAAASAACCASSKAMKKSEYDNLKSDIFSSSLKNVNRMAAEPKVIENLLNTKVGPSPDIDSLNLSCPSTRCSNEFVIISLFIGCFACLSAGP
jgi:hypothetical protein